MSRACHRAQQFLLRESGSSSVPFAVILALTALAVIPVASSFGVSLREFFCSIAASIRVI